MTAQHRADWELPTFKPWGAEKSTGRHARQKPRKRTGSPVPAPKPPKAPAARTEGRVARSAIPPMTGTAQGRGRSRPGVRVGHDPKTSDRAGNRPSDRFAKSSPESRVAARTAYERGQRDAQYATQRAGTKSRGATRGGMSQPKSTRRQLEQRADATGVRHGRHVGSRPVTEPSPSRKVSSSAGRAQRSPSKLPGAPAGKMADPKPQLSGASFFFGGRPQAARK